MARKGSSGSSPREIRINWIIEAAMKADPREDRVVFEDPTTVAELDEILVTTYIPFIRTELEKTGYHYRPTDLASAIESAVADGPRLARKLTFMLFDEDDFLFVRCSVRCDEMGYMVEKEFYFDIPESTDQKLLVRLLGDARFEGNPPSLTVQHSALPPERGTTFWIKFQAGGGFVSGPWRFHGEALADIGRTIKDACEMYEATVDGFQSLEVVDRFLEIASRSFEAS